MILNKKRVLLPAILGGTVLLNTAFAGAAFADDSFSVSVASADGQQCLDTTAQKKFNDDIEMKRVVFPMEKGHYALTSGYGARTSPITGEVGEVHTGTDFAGPNRSPILAVAAGEVMDAGPSIYGGQWVWLRHNIDGKTYDSIYVHLTEGSQKVKKGDKVKPGQQIAEEGSTGMSTGPHLHFEIWEDGFNAFANSTSKNGKHIDSLVWLKKFNAVHSEDTPVYKPLDCTFGTVGKTSNVAWGGYKNGELPANVLKKISFNDNVQVESSAAQNLEELNKEFKKKFKVDMPLIKGYEDLTTQTASQSETVPGKSFFGWGKSVQMKFTHASNPYIPLVSEPDYFTDEQYVWLNENGKAFGWVNPSENQKSGETPDPGRWVFETTATAAEKTINDYKSFTTVSAMTHSWNNTANRQCVMDLWTQDGNWNTLYDQNGETGISKLNADEIKKYTIDTETYKNNPTVQISAGLNYISDRYPTPCDALNTFKEKGSY
jgi:hypothetical protein